MARTAITIIEELEKLRIPQGFDSWTSFAREILSLDEAKVLKDSTPVTSIYDVLPHIKADPTATISKVTEVFKGDLVTIKARAFEELLRVLPDKEGLYRYIDYLRQCERELYYGGQAHDSELLTFLTKLARIL